MNYLRKNFMFRKFTQTLKFFIVIFILMFLLSSCAGQPEKTDAGNKAGVLTLYTTTSVYDSGLLDYLLPPFEKKMGIKVRVIAVGSGEALKNAELGNAEIVLSHAPGLEKEYLEKGVLERLEVIAKNYFVIVGPRNDPAEISRVNTAVEAFKKISENKATFISRGDRSGTHVKELSLWEKAGLDPKTNPGYIEAGAGMADTLRIADQKKAYTLSDIATLSTQKNLQLVPFLWKDRDLENIYSVSIVSLKIIGEKRYALAQKLFDYLKSTEVKQMITEFSAKKSVKGLPDIYIPVYSED